MKNIMEPFVYEIVYGNASPFAVQSIIHTDLFGFILKDQ